MDTLRKRRAIAAVVAGLVGLGAASALILPGVAPAILGTTIAAARPVFVKDRRRDAPANPKPDAETVPGDGTLQAPPQAPVPPAADAPAEAAKVAPAAAPQAQSAPTTSASAPLEKVEADVSTRSVPVTFGFTGTEIIVFGSVDHSRQPSAEALYYDVAVVFEGAPTALVARRKSNVAGLWMNTASLNFDRVPSYYAVASTRPVDEIADAAVLAEHSIGLAHVKIRPRQGRVPTAPEAELKSYIDAVVRLKQKEGLYIEENYDVGFIGRSLFRASVQLPANIPVGPLDARVYLFREGKLLSSYSSRVMLEREGAELWLYGFSARYPLFYGLFAVAIAMSAGLAASFVFRRGAH